MGGKGSSTGGVSQATQDQYLADQKAQQEAMIQELQHQNEEMRRSFSAQQSSTSAAMAASAAELKAARKAAERQALVDQRDQLLSDRLDAEDSAVSYVNENISKNTANARLFGIDYSPTQEQKDAQISNYFASIWGAGEESQLNSLFDRVGKPDNFSGHIYERGDASAVTSTDNKDTTNRVVSTSKGAKPVGRSLASILDSSQTKKDSTTSILGG